MTSSCTHRFVAAVIGFLFSFTLAFAATVKFDIPAQPAPAALKAFIKQSGVQVVFNTDELQTVTTNEVKGEFEPALVLDVLLKDTGFIAAKKAGGVFTIKRAEAPITTGSVKGTLWGEGGKRMAGVLVTIRETTQSAETDRFGEYVFPQVAAGTYVLVANAPGYQPLHITGVQIRAGRELTLGKEAMRHAKEGPLALEPFVVHADAVTELDPYEITGVKAKPFVDGNMDIPRTINDVQPYYIFDAKAIDQSGATNVEDFLKRRLTMNTQRNSYSQQIGGVPNYTGSNITLRGLTANQTLILIDGRRMPAVTLNATSSSYQADLNGVPLAAIERIEVLPASAGAIYGANAVGGVINVILRRNYVGGEVRTTYENTFDSDAPIRTASLTLGFTLEKGRTHVMISGQYSDAEALLLQDRPFASRGLGQIMKNNPASLFGFLGLSYTGSLPNVAGLSNLVLKDGTPLNSRFSYVPAGTSASTSTAALYAGLLANTGQANLTPPPTAQYSLGTTLQMGAVPRTRALMVSIRREMARNLEFFSNFSLNTNQALYALTPATTVPVQASSPVNPFNQLVFLQFPIAGYDKAGFNQNYTVSQQWSNGFTYKLPGGWIMEGDYTWGRTTYDSLVAFTFDAGALQGAINSGALNPFVDTLANPLNLSPYLPNKTVGQGISTLSDSTLRLAGPLWRLPAGTIDLAAGLEHRREAAPDSLYTRTLPISTTSNAKTLYLGKSQSTDSLYLELGVPVIAAAQNVPAVESLDLQLAGRAERFSVATGTSSLDYNYLGVLTTTAPVVTGRSDYSSTNPTVGLRYRPVAGVMIRASFSRAFRAPAYTELAPSGQDGFPSTVADPRQNGALTSVTTFSGGNPDLQPETSESWQVGVVFEPEFLKGLRIDLEWYALEKQNQISTLNTQTIVNNEAVYPTRVTRNSAGSITAVDISWLNLTRLKTTGFDLSASYRFATPSLGTFEINALGTLVNHYKTQNVAGAPLVELANEVPGGGPLKIKTNGSVTWTSGRWLAGWLTEFYGAYRQSPGLVLTQGSDHVPSQIYHSAFLSYTMPAGRHGSADGERARWRERLLAGGSIQVGVKNLFNSVPPFDAAVPTYYSYFGDPRLRAYTISLRKEF